MIVKTRITKTGSEEIQGISVNFNWEHSDGEAPERISANASTSEGMVLNMAYNCANDTQEIQIYGVKGDFPIDLIDGIKAQFELINESFKSVNEA